MASKFVCVWLISMVVMGATIRSEGAVTCVQVTSSLAPCLNYLRGAGTGAVPQPCCNGVKGLNSAAKTTADRQAACRCLKSTAIPGINYGTAAGLPGKCGVSIPFKINPNIDCSKVR